MINSAIWSGLRFFHCVASHLSFTRAAEEMNVTTGAVSQQIKQLESRLHCQLFQRTTRQLHLTEEGELLSQAVARGYRDMDEALGSLTALRLRGRVRLVVISSFCLQWLVPRLGGFYRAFPDIELHLDAQDNLQGMAEGSYDLALDYRFPRSNEEAPFLAEWLIPVCSPALRTGGPLNAKDLLAYPLIHDSAPWAGATQDQEWQHWLAEVGVKQQSGQGQLYFNRADLALQAAETGQGVALGRQELVTDRLASGRLVVACDQKVRSPASYFLQLAPAAQNNARALACYKWLLGLVENG